MDLPAPQSYSPETFRPLTFHDAVPRFRDGSDTPRAYLERCLETIAALEPQVMAFASLNEAGAREAADASTARYRAGAPLLPIDGLPIGIKDLLETRDLPTEMGSAFYKGNRPGRDSALVQALRQAGAVIVGKTVTTELGMSHPGPTRHPFDLRRTPGGSSSGSGAVISARMLPAAIGTQVLGSVIRPASFNANWALKPTQGGINRVERQGFSQSTVGIHAGCAEDMWSIAVEIVKRVGGDPGAPGMYFTGEAPPPALMPRRLAVLETEGLAQYRPRRGYVVAALDPADIAEIFEIRALFEERIGQAAALHRTEEDLVALEAEILAMEALPAGTPEGGRAFGLHNRRFHDRIRAASGMRVMGELLGVLANRVERYIRLGGRLANSREQVNREHRDILAALRDRDGQRLGLLLRLHVHDAGARLLRSLKER